MHHTRIAQRAFNTPLMVEPSKALAFLSGLGPRIAGQEITFHGPDLNGPNIAQAALPAHASLIGGETASHNPGSEDRPFALIDGIAVIKIAGTLVHRGAWIGQSSGLTSYEGITVQIDAAVADPAVRAIALEIDSFGGEVAGAFDLADRIRAAREAKPVHAFVAEHALSAGYVLASQADHITLPRTGAVGSIGVVTLHTEMRGMLEQTSPGSGAFDLVAGFATRMKLKLEISPDIVAMMQAEMLAGERAVTAATRQAGGNLKADWRGQITGAGLGRRLAGSIRNKTYPEKGESLGAAAFIWSKVPKIIRAHGRGALIRSKRGFYLAIPTEAAGKGRRGARLTPGEWERRRGMRLRFIYRRNAPSLLVAEKARLNTRGTAVASRSKTGRGQGQCADLYSGTAGKTA